MDEPANTSVEWLDRDECLRLLAADEVGRLAVVVGHAPMIVPVNYRLDGDRVVFRSDPGTKVDYGLRSPVAFEIDGIDRAAHTGWSVVVAGRLEEPPPYDTKDLEHLHSLPVRPWAGGEKARWLRIVPSHITGRRLGALTRR